MPGATSVPVVIAALAPRMLRIDGEQADGTITWMAGIKTVQSHVVPRITAAAQAANKPHPRVCVGMPIAVTMTFKMRGMRPPESISVTVSLPTTGECWTWRVWKALQKWH